MKTDELIDRIYDAALDPALWPLVLDELSSIAGARGGILATYAVKPKIFMFTEHLASFSEALMKDEEQLMHQLNHQMNLLPCWGFHSDDAEISKADRANLRVYDEILRPHGIGYTAANCVDTPFNDTMIVSLLRDEQRGPVPTEKVDALNTIRPHFARAILMATRHEFQQVQNATQALGAAGMATAAISHRGRILDCNGAFSQLTQQVRIGPSNEIRLMDHQANIILRQSLEQAASGSDPAGNAARSIALPAKGEAGPAILHIIPAGALIKDMFSGIALFAVISPLGQNRPVDVDLIEGLYDLTISEARIAQSLAAGDDVKDIAAKFSITPETVRKHLKNIFSKTGFSRQAELSASIAGIRSIE